MSQSCQRARTLGKFSRQTLIARISCHLHIFIYIAHLTKIPTWKLFTLTPMAQRRKKKFHIVKERKKNLAESDKGPWFGQKPSTISSSAEDPERSNILGASSLKIKVNVSAGCEQDSSSESGGSNEENETYPGELISAIRIFLKLSVDSLTSCFSAAHFPPLTFLARVLPLPLPLASLPIILRRRPELNSTERDKKTMLQCDAFPGKSWSFVIGTRRSCCCIGCGFIRRDNLRAWRELFTNLYKLKSRIWFLEEYIHFERIYRVCRSVGFSWNFARTFQR